MPLATGLKTMPPTVMAVPRVTFPAVPPSPKTAVELLALTQLVSVLPLDHSLSVVFQVPVPSTGLVGFARELSQVSDAAGATRVNPQTASTAPADAARQARDFRNCAVDF